jgi:hypothetical protein
MKKLLTLITLSTALATQVQADDNTTYRVTITNATTHHVLTPPVIAIHNRNFRVFKVADSASQGLITQAETGNPSEISLELENSHGVSSVTTGTDVIPYGQSASFEITAGKRSRISMTSMLATTNDSFAAINAQALPKRSASYFAYAYDAGSEMNNESCSHIPGPPCAANTGNARTETGEGFISVHNGIHGGSDLNAKHLDWRGPVAIVTVTRIDD